MTCDFTPFSTAFQSYQDDVRVIMKDRVVNGTSFTVGMISVSNRARTCDR